jgi:aryl carrier-like protein
MILGNKNHGQQQLTTFWIPASGRENDKRRLHLTSVVQTLFGELSLTLPDYMVPSSLIPVEKIPMTAVRKIDERKLKAFFAELNADDLQPFSRLHVTSEQRGLSEAENAVARVISEATQTPLQNLQPSTSIYSLGIDSLSAIPLSRQLRQAGFGQIDVSVILRHGSISELAKVITKFEQKRQQTGDSKEEKPFDEEYVHQIHLQFSKAGHNVHSVIPCTPLQEAMLSRTVSKNKNAYCNHLLFEVSGDLWLLRTTWEQMVRKHEILRTCFAATANGRFAYAQVILQSMNVPWTCVKTNANDMDTEICRQKSRFIMNMAQDVYVAPYSIVAFQDSQNDRNMLLFSIHHALHDGEAMSQLLKEVERCYGGHDQSQVPQFRHFVEYMLCSNKEESEQFWHQYLRGISPQLLCSALKLTSDAGASRYQQHKIDLEIDLQDFEKMCKNLSVTALNIFHAAWSRMLSAYTLSSDVCFGNVFSGRTIPLDGVESIIGPCFNTLPIRLQIPSTALNMDVVKLAHQANVDIMPHQLSSLRQIQKRATHDGLSLFDTLFLLQSPFRGLDGTLWKLVEEEGDMDFPLVVEIIPSLDRNRIRICLHSDSLCVPSSDARMVAENFMNLVCHTLKYPAAQAMDSSIFTGDLPSFVTAARITKSSGSHAHDFSSPTDSAMHTLSKDEVHVQDMLSRLSGRKSAGIKRDTSIFQLGLDSINAVQLSNLFQNAGNDVSAADILEVRYFFIILESI